MYSFSLY